MLLLAHIDVVDAKRADWERDPFTLIEENGFFYGRGAADDKSMAAVFLDLMIRLKQERGFKPKRDLIMALTCGEETSNRVNGVDYLLKNRRELIDAAFAINEGAGGLLSSDGQTARVAGAGRREDPPGVHARSHQPRWTFLAAGAAKTRSTAWRGRAEGRATVVSDRGHAGRARVFPRHRSGCSAAKSAQQCPRWRKIRMTRRAVATLTKDPSYNAILHTTCVVTQLDAGHAPNALPQRATATLSCRVMQGTTPEQVQGSA